MKPALKILMLEDDIFDADLIQRLLKKEKLHCEVRLAMSKEEFVYALETFSPDVILSDNSLPHFNSSEALKLIRRQLQHTPFILVTGTASEEYAASIIKQGADDYILKDRMARLPAAIIAALKQRLTEKEMQETIEQLKENEKKYRDLVERISDGFYALNLNWDIIYVNKKAEELMNKPAGYLIGKNIWTEFPEANDRAFYKAYYLAMQTQENSYLKEYSSALDKWIETNIYPSATGISVYFRDITEQQETEENLKLLEKKIQEQKIQEQKKIARAIIIAQEKERNHIGQELHDNINQILVGAKLFLSVAGNKNETVKELIKYPIELIDSSIKEIRLLCHKLVTPFKDINLEELVQDLIKNLNQNTIIKTDFTYAVSEEFISDDLKLNIYRITQEQINNILKYAEAKNVSISIKEEYKNIIIIVSDDGKGFDVNSKREGIGISNMINRIESFNGKIEIESSIDNGCRTQIHIPY